MGEHIESKEINNKWVLEILKNGNQNFVDNWRQRRNYRKEVRNTASGQTPFAAVLSCIDSRVPVETIFDVGIGDVFSFRAAGNFVDPKIEENNNILGSLEFAKISGVQLILVLGHTGCGAVKAAIAGDPTECKQTNIMVGRLQKNITTTDENAAIRENVLNTIKHIRKLSDCLREFNIEGGIYDISTGEVEFID